MTLSSVLNQFSASLPAETAYAYEAPVATSSVEYVMQRVDYYADLYGVPRPVMHYVVNCESGYDPKARGDYSTSTGYTSFGTVQINEPSHPTITREQAEDVEFSLNFLGSNIAKGKGGMWTCFKLMNKKLSQ